MNLTNFKTKMDKTIFESYTLRFVVSALAIVVIAQMIFIGIIIGKQKTIVLPPRVSRSFWVAGNRVSQGYLIQMGDYLSQTVLNFTPKDYKEQLGNFMVYVLPARYKAINTALESQIKSVTTLGVSSVFYPTRTIIKGNTLTVTGVTHRFKGGKLTGSQEIVVLGYRIVNGRFYISKILVKGAVA